jgi:signal transduction histidine kinase
MPDPNHTSVVEAYARLLSLAVHELRTPASVVAGYLRMLQRDADTPLSDRHRKLVTEAERSCTRLVALVSELSEISKLDAGAAEMRDEPIDVFELVQKVAGDVHEAAEREVRLEVRGEGAGARMRGDRARLEAAFAAFFRAILREQAAGTTVTADRRLERQGPQSSAVVVIARHSDVQRSYDADRAAFDEKRGGLGLALPIACRVVARHGGQVWSPASKGSGDPAGRSAAVIALPLAESSS